MLRSLNLEDFIQQRPIRIKAEANIMEAVDLILAHRISGVCVVDDFDNLVGVLSELDCLNAILGATYNESGLGQVSDYMTSEKIQVADRNCDIVEVAQEMITNHMRRRPVVEHGKLVGQITCRQLLQSVRSFTR